MQLLYLDSTRCDRFPVSRQRPAITEWKSVYMKYREKIELEAGGFGLLPNQEDICTSGLESKVLYKIKFCIKHFHK